GEQKAIGKAVASIKGMSETKWVTYRHRRVEILLQEDANNSQALANVFMVLTDNKINLVSIRSVGQQTEKAFLDLVEKEESRGFARAYQHPPAPPSQAARGLPSQVANDRHSSPHPPEALQTPPPPPPLRRPPPPR